MLRTGTKLSIHLKYRSAFIFQLRCRASFREPNAQKLSENYAKVGAMMWRSKEHYTANIRLDMHIFVKFLCIYDYLGISSIRISLNLFDHETSKTMSHKNGWSL
jgi:hypothetical protein